MGGVIYRMYNNKGELLYIGKSIKIDTRLHNHGKTKEWWNEVSNITLEHVYHDNLDDLEVLYIRNENPKYNVVRYTNELGNPLQVVSKFFGAREVLHVDDYPSGLLEVLDFLDKKSQWPPYSGIYKFQNNLDWICNTLRPYGESNPMEIYELIKFMKLWTKYMMFRAKINAGIK